MRVILICKFYHLIKSDENLKERARQRCGTMHIHFQIQENSAKERPARKFERAQSAPHQRQYAHRTRRGCPDDDGPAGSRPAQHHPGHLQPCL